MLHEKLKAARIERKLKQSEVAALLGCASTSFTNWETGRVNPPLEQLERICVIYGISPLDLLTRRPSLADIHEIANLPLAGRSYEETVALTFCGEVLGRADESLTTDEDEILRIFRSLSDQEKTFVLKMLRGL